MPASFQRRRGLLLVGDEAATGHFTLRGSIIDHVYMHRGRRRCLIRKSSAACPGGRDNETNCSTAGKVYQMGLALMRTNKP